jgi:flagellar protein FliO/FliZ
MKNFFNLQLVTVLICGSFSFSTISAELVSNEKIETIKVTPLESLLPMLFGLISILAVIFLLAILVKKVTGLNIISSNIKVLESQSLGAKEKLVIVEIQEQQYVLGVTAQSINQICQLKNRIEKRQSSVPFDKIMKQFLKPNDRVEKKSVEVK